jgi:lysophospholipase L1-like esterase
VFEHFIALGDSMSMDIYPAFDAESAGTEWKDNLGAASLFHHNEALLFPEFRGKDLQQKYPKSAFSNLCLDGATCEDLLSDSIKQSLIGFSDAKVLVTLTLGGNDLLRAYRGNSDQVNFSAAVANLVKQYQDVISMIRAVLQNSVLILTTVYDPTDRTGMMPSNQALYQRKLHIEYLELFKNNVVSSANHSSVLIADVHKHFLGHGSQCTRPVLVLDGKSNRTRI